METLSANVLDVVLFSIIGLSTCLAYPIMGHFLASQSRIRYVRDCVCVLLILASLVGVIASYLPELTALLGLQYPTK